jgi:hypothetical protein
MQQSVAVHLRQRVHVIGFHGIPVPSAKPHRLVMPRGPEVQEQATEVALADKREIERVGGGRAASRGRDFSNMCSVPPQVGIAQVCAEAAP